MRNPWALLKAAGCDVIRAEKVSGKSRDGRHELATVMDFIRPGDERVVVKLDRLGRSTRDVLNLAHELEEKGAALTVIEPSFSTKDATGSILVAVLGMVPEIRARRQSTRCASSTHPAWDRLRSLRRPG